jgi:predicted lipoprotein with Yx(FWY)xxD motif
MVSRTHKKKLRAGGAAAFLVLALIVAGCGSSSSSSSSVASAAPASSPSASGISVSMTSGSHGGYLTGPTGRAVYLWDADTNGKSVCSGACAKAWPPVITKGAPVAMHGITASDLGTITRSDGAKQVTYKGHPLYYFVEDSSAGMTKGQGSDSFGAKWWLVSPAGSAITSGSPTAVASTSSGSSGMPSSGY